MKRELTDDEAKNDVIRAKENKERVEKMQAQYFLQKYDLRLSFENKKKVKEIQQKHLEDIQLMIKCFLDQTERRILKRKLKR